MGSKGISYFTYWTPPASAGLSNEYMVSRDGTKNDIYYWVKEINADINTIGKKLLHCHADGSISHSTSNYPVFDNQGAGRTHYGPIKAVNTAKGVYLVGCFRDARISMNGDDYKGYKALVTPRLPARGNIIAKLSLDLSVDTVTLTFKNNTETVQLDNTLNKTIFETISVSYNGGDLTLNIPEGEAVLIEF